MSVTIVVVVFTACFHCPQATRKSFNAGQIFSTGVFLHIFIAVPVRSDEALPTLNTFIHCLEAKPCTAASVFN